MSSQTSCRAGGLSIGNICFESGNVGCFELLLCHYPAFPGPQLFPSSKRYLDCFPCIITKVRRSQLGHQAWVRDGQKYMAVSFQSASLVLKEKFKMHNFSVPACGFCGLLWQHFGVYIGIYTDHSWWGNFKVLPVFSCLSNGCCL